MKVIVQCMAIESDFGKEIGKLKEQEVQMFEDIKIENITNETVYAIIK